MIEGGREPGSRLYRPRSAAAGGNCRGVGNSGRSGFAMRCGSQNRDPPDGPERPRDFDGFQIAFHRLPTKTCAHAIVDSQPDSMAKVDFPTFQSPGRFRSLDPGLWRTTSPLKTAWISRTHFYHFSQSFFHSWKNPTIFP